MGHTVRPSHISCSTFMLPVSVCCCKTENMPLLLTEWSELWRSWVMSWSRAPHSCSLNSEHMELSPSTQRGRVWAHTMSDLFHTKCLKDRASPLQSWEAKKKKKLQVPKRAPRSKPRSQDLFMGSVSCQSLRERQGCGGGWGVSSTQEDSLSEVH